MGTSAAPGGKTEKMASGERGVRPLLSLRFVRIHSVIYYTAAEA